MKGERISLRNRDEIYLCLAEESDPKLRLKLAFLACFSRLEMDLDLLCEAFGIAVPAGYWWIRNWILKGCDGLLVTGQRSGRPPRLDDIDLASLKSLLQARPGLVV